jgi:hypothetical protein
MQHEGWNTVIDQGTVGSLIKSTAESEAEIARYLEYLFLEKKWRTARNMSSLTHLADLISRRRELPISAVGFVIVSHTDAAGADRLNGYGSVYYDLDQTSDYDDLTQNTDASLVEKETLVPWTSDAVYQIPRGTVFKSARGTEYVATETVEIRPLKEPYSMISSDPVKLDDFRRAG